MRPPRSDATLCELVTECRALGNELASTAPRTRAQRLDLVNRTRQLLALMERRLRPPEPAPVDRHGDDYSDGGGLATEAMAQYRREAMALRSLTLRRAAETVFGGAETQAWIDRQVLAKTLRYSTIDRLQDVLDRLEREQRIRRDRRASERSWRR